MQVGFGQDFEATKGLQAGMANRAFRLMEAGECMKRMASRWEAKNIVSEDWAFRHSCIGHVSGWQEHCALVVSNATARQPHYQFPFPTRLPMLTSQAASHALVCIH